MKIPFLSSKIRSASLQNRFLYRVLLPPFLVLLLLSLLAFWQLNRAVRNSAIESLSRAASATAAKIEREFAIRETVLTTTGTELFNIKSEYLSVRSALETQHTTCKDYVRSGKSYLKAPDNACEPFLAYFAKNTGSPAQAVETGYTEQATLLNQEEQDAIKERLDAFVKFFPETQALLIIDKDGAVVSQAASSSEEETFDTEGLVVYAKQSLETPIEGELINESSRQLVFAYSIESGAVAVAYNLDHLGFIHSSWQSAPIDSTEAYAVVTNPNGSVSYPLLEDKTLYEAITPEKAVNQSVLFSSKGVNYLAVADTAGKSDWRIIVGSPAAIVLEPVRTAQIGAVLVIGTLLVSFLWVGTIFVKRTVGSILILVNGALVFASNKLDYHINLSKHSDEEFNKLADTMNTMATRIQEAEKEIDQKNKEFISVATHELKAPMTAIIGNLSMVIEDGVGQVDEAARKLTKEAYDGTVRLRNLVSEMLDIARIESGRTEFKLAPLDIMAEVQAMIDLQRVPAQEKQITIVHQPPVSPLPMVSADQTKLEIILTNFISNGIKYNRSPGTVTVSHVLEGGFVKVSISDTGLGIPADQQANMFQKFFRVSGEDRKNIPGTGLGMYITKQFIEAMGGKLWFESIAGQGTTFYFTLPLASHNSSIPQAITPL